MYHQDFGKGYPRDAEGVAIWTRPYNAGVLGVHLCPVAKEPKNLPFAQGGGERPFINPGTAANCWAVAATMNTNEDSIGSYAMNGWLCSGI